MIKDTMRSNEIHKNRKIYDSIRTQQCMNQIKINRIDSDGVFYRHYLRNRSHKIQKYK